MEKPKITVVCPTMNVDPWWFKTTILSAHKGSTEGQHEFLVFSNEHKPITDTLIERLVAEGVNIRLCGASVKNEGVAIAVNECAVAAQAEYILYTDDDRYFMPGWDKVLLDRSKGHEEDWLYLTSKAIEPTGTNPCMVAPHDFGRDERTFDEQELLAFWNGLPKRDCISCAGPPFAARWIWEKLRYFDIGYFPGLGTDPDFSMRLFLAAKDAGKTARFIGLGHFGTYHGQCLSTSRVRTDGASLASHIRFQNKFGCTTRDFSRLVGDGTPLD